MYSHPKASVLIIIFKGGTENISKEGMEELGIIILPYRNSDERKYTSACLFTGDSYLPALDKHLALTASHVSRNRYRDKNNCIPLAKYLKLLILTAASGRHSFI